MFRSFVAVPLTLFALASFPLASCVSGGSPASRAAPAPGAAIAPTATNVLPGVGQPAVLPSGGFAFVSLEGPFWAANTGRLLFSDVVEANAPGARIYEFDPATGAFSIHGYPGATTAGTVSTNGLALDTNGALLACERYNARVVRVLPALAPPNGAADAAAAKLVVLAERAPSEGDGQAGLPFNAPNDLVVRRDGNIYFTDSDWGTRPGVRHAPMGVYRLSPQGAVTRALTMDKPNGIALSPDGATLYVGSDAQAKIWSLPVDAAGVPGAPTLLIDGARVPGGFKVPDGICVDDAGTLYVTNNADDVRAIVVFDGQGRLQGRIPFPAAPSNCTFGGPDRRTMYVTTLHAVYRVAMPTPGLP